MVKTTSSTPVRTWLEVMKMRLNVDIDWMDPSFIKSLPSKPHDMTSNQLWMGIQLADASNKELLGQTAQELYDHDWLATYTKMAALLCKENIDHIQNRVLVQTSPAQADDEDKTVDHAREYAKEFKLCGISPGRFCIKIPATPAGVLAMRKLSTEGIPVLGTAVFSVEQAIACSQAGCLYISPYFNEVRSHEDPSLWPEVRDPAIQHNFAFRIYQMAYVYKQLQEKTGAPQPLIKLAAFRHIREVIAASELGCHSITVSAPMMQQLADTAYDSSLDLGDHWEKPYDADVYTCFSVPSERLQPLLASDPLKDDFKPVNTTINYLENNAAKLGEALERDPVGKQRLEDAIGLFVRAEQASKTLIESMAKRPML